MYNNEISEWNIGSFTQPTAQYHVGVTNTSGRIDSSAFIDINSMTAAQSAGSGTVNYAVSTDGRTTWSINKGTDGVRPIVRNNSGTWQYNSAVGTSGFGFSNTATYDSVSYNFSSTTNTIVGFAFKPDGTKFYLVSDSSDQVIEFTCSTAWDITSASYSNFYAVGGQTNRPRDIAFKPDGTAFLIADDQNNRINQYNLSTAWDISSSSYVAYNDTTTTISENNPQGVAWNNDGTKYFIIGSSNNTVYQYNVSSAYNTGGTVAYSGNSFSVTNQTYASRGLKFNPDGTKMFVVTTNGQSPYSGDHVFEYDLSTAFDVTSATFNSNVINVSSQVTDAYGVGFKDDGTKLYVADYSGNILYQYSTLTDGYGTATNWVNSTVNDEFYALQQVLGVSAINLMDKTQLDAIPDANHFSTGTSLDLMIALRMDTAASTLPTSDGVTLNYDAAALNEGAVLGTDYDFFHPANNKVQIKSLAAQNLKVRVV